MLTLDEYNKHFGRLSSRNGARVSCPECILPPENREVEMVFTCPGMMLLTSPGQYHVHCPSCGFKSTRYE